MQTEQNNIKNALTEHQNTAIHKFEEIQDVIPDKSVKISELPNTLAKLMMSKGFKYEDFAEVRQVEIQQYKISSYRFFFSGFESSY